jgi:hypothetical protein
MTSNLADIPIHQDVNIYCWQVTLLKQGHHLALVSIQLTTAWIWPG